MPGLDDVLERLVNEPDFRDQLTNDPKTALTGYELSTDDLEVLATHVSAGSGGLGSVEQRTTKAGLFGLFASMIGGGGDGSIIDDNKFEFDTEMRGGPDTSPGEDQGVIVHWKAGIIDDNLPGGEGDEAGIVVQNEGDEAGIILQNEGDEGGIKQNEGAGEFFDTEMRGGPDTSPGEDQGVIVDWKVGIIDDNLPGGEGDEAGIVVQNEGDEAGIILQNEGESPPDDKHFDTEMRGGPDTSPGEDQGMVIEGGKVGIIDDNKFGGDEQGIVIDNSAPNPEGEAGIIIDMIIDGGKGGPGGDVDAVMFKEVDPAPAAPDDSGIEMLGDEVQGPSPHM